MRFTFGGFGSGLLLEIMSELRSLRSPRNPPFPYCVPLSAHMLASHGALVGMRTLEALGVHYFLMALLLATGPLHPPRNPPFYHNGFGGLTWGRQCISSNRDKT